MNWPPPEPAGTTWETRHVRLNGREETYRLRTINISGTIVQIDADGRFFCEGCQDVFTLQEVTAHGTGHKGGRLRPAMTSRLINVYPHPNDQ